MRERRKVEPRGTMFALLAVYQEVRDRDPQWRGAMDKWPVHTCRPDGSCEVDPCGFDWETENWEGVSCRYQWNWDKSVPRVVTNFHLPKRSLSGPMPRSLVLLANLTEIDLDANRLTGALPPEWGCLKNLIEIDISNNRLVGSIPPEWGLLKNLVELELDGNGGLSGCVPEGAPPFNRWCGGLFGPPCPGFTRDPLIGTDVSGTRVRTGSRCPPFPGGDAALAAGLRCPVVADFRESVLRFFAAKNAGGGGGGGGGAPRIAAAAVAAAPDGAAVNDNIGEAVGPSKK
ncbi:hypothetical protein GPECTOR_32g443 [Gonium pectorale]|uniref:Leucine-rich repeat-containing N-terminal plant-type domain-containing protein n=1 Tax=Gonium pectorale TaxID=33097 RepID=A0A150GD96_GONPE|nr:hypothetical protein GPECTOR_32g443 [Gonium pectorale]|eukprot:KXZ47831.1 hypothetical protein GPECTOR_32g443 [Gonium pectorale]